MLLWRVGVNALPIRDNLMIKMGVDNQNCLLCNQVVESPIHLFFKCSTTKAIWFATCWGFKSDQVPLHSNLDMVKLILNPPPPPPSPQPFLCQAQD